MTPATSSTKASNITGRLQKHRLKAHQPRQRWKPKDNSHQCHPDGHDCGRYLYAGRCGRGKMQYSKDNVNWQDSPVFGGLEPGSSYRFYARVGATANTIASAASVASAQVTTKTAVLEPVLEKDGDCFAGQSCKIEL